MEILDYFDCYVLDFRPEIAGRRNRVRIRGVVDVSIERDSGLDPRTKLCMVECLLDVPKGW